MQKIITALISLILVGSSAAFAAEEPTPLANSDRIKANSKFRPEIFELCTTLLGSKSPNSAKSWKELKRVYKLAGIESRLKSLQSGKEADFLKDERIAADPDTSIEVTADGGIRLFSTVSEPKRIDLYTPPDDPGYEQQIAYCRKFYWWFDFSRIHPVFHHTVQPGNSLKVNEKTLETMP